MDLQALGKPHRNRVGPHTLQIVHGPRPAALLALLKHRPTLVAAAVAYDDGTFLGARPYTSVQIE